MGKTSYTREELDQVMRVHINRNANILRKRLEEREQELQEIEYV